MTNRWSFCSVYWGCAADAEKFIRTCLAITGGGDCGIVLMADVKGGEGNCGDGSGDDDDGSGGDG